jgi:hypothetical protein
MKLTTSWASAWSNAASAKGSASAGATATWTPGRRRRHASANGTDRSTCAQHSTGRPERAVGSDGEADQARLRLARPRRASGRWEMARPLVLFGSGARRAGERRVFGTPAARGVLNPPGSAGNPQGSSNLPLAPKGAFSCGFLAPQRRVCDGLKILVSPVRFRPSPSPGCGASPGGVLARSASPSPSRSSQRPTTLPPDRTHDHRRHADP